MNMSHFGDPCIHCGIGHDDVPVGPCQGDPSKIKIIRYGVIRQAWQNPGSQCDDVIVLMSDGSTHRESHHPSYHWPYSDRFKDAKCVGRDEILTSEAANLKRERAIPTNPTPDKGEDQQS